MQFFRHGLRHGLEVLLTHLKAAHACLPLELEKDLVLDRLMLVAVDQLLAGPLTPRRMA